MNTDIISRWLQSPDTLPDEAAVKSLLHSWPWFMPARVMEAAHKHRHNPFSPQSLSLIHLYGPDWVSGYRLLAAAGEIPFHTMSDTEPSELAPAVANEYPDAAGSEDDKAGGLHHDLPADNAGLPFIQPLYTEDYFRHQGIEAAEPEEGQPIEAAAQPEQEDPKTLMVMMSFAEWLSHFKVRSEKEQEEAQEKRALRSMWQQEKLAAALQDEPDEIPEDVFEMAVSSITREDDLVSESLAEILEQQEKWSAAAEMYRKLGLRNPAKNAYFASRAEAAKKRLI